MVSKQLEGREHYVVPVVMIVEGVLNGSDGALYYPVDELQTSAKYWNGRPVVVYHPSMYGSPEANHPSIFSLQRVGTVFNTRLEGQKLKADAWLDPDRLQAVDHRVLEAVVRNDVVEVSTGLFLDKEPVAGVFNGKQYSAIARNYRPDHLAILPDLTGACSIADGAGLCRNLAGQEEPLLVPVMNFAGRAV